MPGTAGFALPLTGEIFIKYHFPSISCFSEKGFLTPIHKVRLTCWNTTQHLTRKLFELKVWRASGKDIFQGLSYKRTGSLTCSHCGRWKTHSDQQGPYFTSTGADGHSQPLTEEANLTTAAKQRSSPPRAGLKSLSGREAATRAEARQGTADASGRKRSAPNPAVSDKP